MEILLENDDLCLVLLDTLDQISPLSHRLDGSFDCFRSGVHREDHLFAGEFRKLFGKEWPAIVEEGPRCKSKDVGLILQRLDDLRMPVSLIYRRVCR